MRPTINIQEVALQPIALIAVQRIVPATFDPRSDDVQDDKLNAFDEALSAIFDIESLELISLMSKENDDDDDDDKYGGTINNPEIQQYLNVPLLDDNITINYIIDAYQKLPKVAVTYTRNEVKDVRGFLRVVGEFYDRQLTDEQLAMVRAIDPSNEALFTNAIYNALINRSGALTDLNGFDISPNGVYDIKLH